MCMCDLAMFLSLDLLKCYIPKRVRYWKVQVGSVGCDLRSGSNNTLRCSSRLR